MEYEDMKTTDLIDLYGKLNDEESVKLVGVLWTRFPFETLEAQYEDYQENLISYSCCNHLSNRV